MKCRLCYSQLSLHLFRTLFNTENEPPFLDIITKLTDVDISESDSYSKMMCINCYDKLVNVYDFLKIIKETDTKFRHNFNNNRIYNEIKEENVVQLEIKQEMDCEIDEHVEIDSNDLNESKLIDNKTEIDIDNCFAAMIKEEINGSPDNDKEEEENCDTVEMDENASNNETDHESTIENFNCKICGKIFKHKNDLTKHQKTHDKLYRCYICKAILTNLDDLEEHKRFHATNKPHECKICKKTFLHKRYLLKHLKTHLYDIDEKPLKCSLCDREFTRKDTFRKHKKTHEDNTTYECDICEKVFEQFLDLRNHKLEHLDKVYECNVCGKKFKNQQQSFQHLKKVHFGEKTHQCGICGEKFRIKSLLTKHFRSHKDKVEITIKEIANSPSGKQ